MKNFHDDLVLNGWSIVGGEKSDTEKMKKIDLLRLFPRNLKFEDHIVMVVNSAENVQCLVGCLTCYAIHCSLE